MVNKFTIQPQSNAENYKIMYKKEMCFKIREQFLYSLVKLGRLHLTFL